jgi:MFS family permease
MDSYTSLDYTFHYDKYSCSRPIYFFHVVLAYFIVLTGLFAMISRLFDRLKFLHAWMGRFYILSMLWATATSMLIHNTGLPAAVLYSFLWVMLGLTIGWILIKVRELLLDRMALKCVEKQLTEGGLVEPLDKMIMKAKMELIPTHFAKRVFSLKGIHGSLMFVTWLNIAGRLFASDQSGDFTCHTYPVYKPLNTNHFDGFGKNETERLVPMHDPKYNRLPWAYKESTWAVALLLGPLIAGFLFGLVYSYFNSRRSVKPVPKYVEKATNEEGL